MWTGLLGKSHYHKYEKFKSTQSSNTSEHCQGQIVSWWVFRGHVHDCRVSGKEVKCSIWRRTGFWLCFMPGPVIHKGFLLTASRLPVIFLFAPTLLLSFLSFSFQVIFVIETRCAFFEHIYYISHQTEHGIVSSLIRRHSFVCSGNSFLSWPSSQKLEMHQT
jgi:hypothetical protein